MAASTQCWVGLLTHGCVVGVGETLVYPLSHEHPRVVHERALDDLVVVHFQLLCGLERREIERWDIERGEREREEMEGGEREGGEKEGGEIEGRDGEGGKRAEADNRGEDSVEG